MSAKWLKLLTFFCLSCTALTGDVIWKDSGEAVTIRCSSPNKKEDSLNLVTGFKDDRVLFKEKNSKQEIIAEKFKGRLQVNGEITSLHILIKNLTSDDTGPYWCHYSRFDERTQNMIETNGSGSVLLVVKGAGQGVSAQCPCSAAPAGLETVKECEPADKNLIVVSVVISAAVLLGIITGIFIWIIKTKLVCGTVKPQRAPTNDVYEDMRGTLRR